MQNHGAIWRIRLDGPTSVEIAKHTLMSGGLILAVGTVTGLFAQRTKIPDVAAFLLASTLRRIPRCIKSSCYSAPVTSCSTAGRRSVFA